MLTVVAAHFKWATDANYCCLPYHAADVPCGTFDTWEEVNARLAELKAANPLLSYAVRAIRMDYPEVYEVPKGLTTRAKTKFVEYALTKNIRVET